MDICIYIYFSLTQSRSFLKSLDNLGSVRLNRIMSTLRRRKRPRGGSPARITFASARCLASSDFSRTSEYPCALRIPALLIGMITLIFIYFGWRKIIVGAQIWTSHAASVELLYAYGYYPPLFVSKTYQL